MKLKFSIGTKLTSSFVSVTVLNILLVMFLGVLVAQVRNIVASIVPDANSMHLYQNFGSKLETLVLHVDKIDQEGYPEFQQMALNDTNTLFDLAKQIDLSRKNQNQVQINEFTPYITNIKTDLLNIIGISGDKSTQVLNNSNIDIYQSIEKARQLNQIASDDNIMMIFQKTQKSQRFVTTALILFIIGGLFINIFGISIIFYLSRWIVQPLKKLSIAANEIGTGNFNTLVDIKTEDEFGEVASAINNMTHKLSVYYQTLEAEVKKRTRDSQDKISELETTKIAMLNLLDDERELEEEIKIERDRVKTIISSMGEGMCVIDLEGKIVEINPTARELINNLDKNFVGTKWNEIIQVYVGEIPLEESKWPYAIAYKSKQHVSIGLDDNYYYKRSDGHFFPVGIDATPIITGDSVSAVVILFRDLTKEKKEKEIIETIVKERTKELVEKNQALELAKVQISEGWLEQQREKAKLSASINSLTIGFIMTDASERIITMNNSAYKIFNLTGEVNDMKMLEERLTASVELHKLHQQCLVDRHQINATNVLYDNRYLSIKLMPIFMQENTELIGVVILVEDITEAKILERSKDEFFSIASHELRTPLTAIRGNTSLIKDYYFDKLTDKDLKEMLSDIHESSIRLIAIVNDFLDMSRLEQGRMKFNLINIDIVSLVDESLKSLMSIADQKQDQLISEITNNSVPDVLADRDKLKEVLINLIGNALKFTENGKIIISAKVIPQQEHRLKIFITDTGKGISKENQALLFRKFQQAEVNIMTRDGTKGTGLGLYISKLLIDGMGGEIYLEKSEEGQGSTFAFLLPIAK
jgi:two-component system, sensor histidine kinase and response regulator